MCKRPLLKLEQGISIYYRFSGFFQVQLGEILGGWAFCYRRKAQNLAVSSSKVSFFTFSWSGRPILPHVCMAKLFLVIHFALKKLLLTFFNTYLVFILCNWVRRRGDSVAVYGLAAHPLGDRGGLCVAQHGLYNLEKPSLQNFVCAV